MAGFSFHPLVHRSPDIINNLQKMPQPAASHIRQRSVEQQQRNGDDTSSPTEMQNSNCNNNNNSSSINHNIAGLNQSTSNGKYTMRSGYQLQNTVFSRDPLCRFCRHRFTGNFASSSSTNVLRCQPPDRQPSTPTHAIGDRLNRRLLHRTTDHRHCAGIVDTAITSDASPHPFAWQPTAAPVPSATVLALQPERRRRRRRQQLRAVLSSASPSSASSARRRRRRRLRLTV